MGLTEKPLANIFASIPDNLDDELIEVIAANENVTIERIVSRGHATVGGWYEQEKNEWIMVLKGEAVIAFDDGKEVRLKVGDYLTISAHRKHKVKWTDEKAETVWLAVHH